MTDRVTRSGRYTRREALGLLGAAAAGAGAGGYFEDIGFAIYPVRVAEMTEDELVEELVADAAAQHWGAFGEILVDNPRRFLAFVPPA